MQALTRIQTVFRRQSTKASLLGLALLLPAGAPTSAQAASLALSSVSATAAAYSSSSGSSSSSKCCCCSSDEQDKVIKKLIYDHTVVTVILVNGVRLQGIIKAADCKVIIIECSGIAELI